MDRRPNARPAPRGREALAPRMEPGAPVAEAPGRWASAPRHSSSAAIGRPPRSACGGLPPMSRIPGVSNLLAHSS